MTSICKQIRNEKKWTPIIGSSIIKAYIYRGREGDPKYKKTKKKGA